jgi:futalosine hydrolase
LPVNPDICNMNVLIAVATPAEIQVMNEFLEKQNFRINRNEISILITGIGGIATTYNLTKRIRDKAPEFIIQAGIAGSFQTEFPIGSVVCVREELIGDMGAEENNQFKDLFDLGLMEENDIPFSRKFLINPFIENQPKPGLPLVRSIGINEITTREERIQFLKEKYNPDIESMEGAAFHYVCLKEKIPFLQIRAISNYVGERNKQNWDLQQAIGNLNIRTTEILRQL